MKKIILILITALLVSCSENGDQYIGNYKSGYRYTLIKKAGDDGYFLTFGESNENEYSVYCVFKNGCFTRIYKGEEFPIMCRNGEKLINNNGLIFNKVKFLK